MTDGCASSMMSAAAPPLSDTLTSVSCWPEGTSATLDIDARGRLEGRQRRGEVVALAADPLGLHRDLGALEGLVGAQRLVELGVAGGRRRDATAAAPPLAAGLASCARTPPAPLNTVAVTASPASSVALCDRIMSLLRVAAGLCRRA